MKKPLYKEGDIIMVKSNSLLFTESMYLSEYYPYMKVYKVSVIFNPTEQPYKGYEYQIGAVDKFNYDYWGTLRFVDFYEKDYIFQHMSDKVQDHFYTNQEVRKMKLNKLCQNI